MLADEKFNQIYQRILNENKDEMENTRKEAKVEKKQNIILAIIMILTDIAIVYGTYKYFGYVNDMVWRLIGVFIVISIFVYIKIINRDGKSKIRKYKADFKTKIISALVKSFEENLEYLPKQGFDPMVFKEAEFEKYDRYYSEDLIKGMLKNNCDFEIAEVITEREYSDSEGHTTTTQIFRGLVTKMEIPKSFNTSLYLRKDRKDKGLVNRAFLEKLPFDELRVELDSPEFEKLFDVYASDKIVAMQLLTADIMEDLIKFHNEMKIKYEITIKENYMYIRFWCGKMFEAAKLKKFSLDRDTLYKYYKMLDFTFKLTDKMLKVLNETPV